MKTRTINLRPNQIQMGTNENGGPILVFKEYRPDTDTIHVIKVSFHRHWWLGHVAEVMKGWMHGKIDDLNETLEKFKV